MYLTTLIFSPASLWAPVPNFISFNKYSHSSSLQCPGVTYLSICQTVIEILGHISRCVFRLRFLHRQGFASYPLHLPLVSSSDRASVPIWHLSTSSLPHHSLPSPLSSTQSAVSRCPDGDEEGCWGQCHLTMPPPIPIIRLSWHRVATAETKLQTESGEMGFPFFPVARALFEDWLLDHCEAAAMLM